MRQQDVFGSVLVLILGGAFCARAASAQPADHGPIVSEGVQVTGGFDGVYAMATGELSRSFDHGWGGGGHVSFFKGHTPLALAVEGWAVQYGEEETRRRLFADSGRLLVDVSTTNWIGHLSLGPELAARAGRVRPYAKALVGFSYFATSTSVSGSDDVEDFATTTHQDDFNLSGVLCAGVRVPLKRRLALDVSARYVWNGEAAYLVEGDIREDAAGNLLFDPRRTQANLLLFSVGLTFGR